MRKVESVEAAPIPDDLITPNKAAKVARVSISSIYRWILSGMLPAFKRGGSRYLVSRKAVLACLVPVRPKPGMDWRKPA